MFTNPFLSLATRITTYPCYSNMSNCTVTEPTLPPIEDINIQDYEHFNAIGQLALNALLTKRKKYKLKNYNLEVKQSLNGTNTFDIIVHVLYKNCFNPCSRNHECAMTFSRPGINEKFSPKLLFFSCYSLS